MLSLLSFICADRYPPTGVGGGDRCQTDMDSAYYLHHVQSMHRASLPDSWRLPKPAHRNLGMDGTHRFRIAGYHRDGLNYHVWIAV